MNIATPPSETAAHPLVRRLRQFTELLPDDEACLVRLTREVTTVPADCDLKSHGERPEAVHIVLDGLACRYKILPDGRRQIMAFLVPGDPCDLQVFVLENMDHGVCTLAPSRIATVAPQEILNALEERPRLMRAFWASTLVDEAVLREWLVNIGRRDAYERIAHLLWELYLRHRVVGRANGSSFELPLTQQELADALGLSAVHINRTLQRLRADQVVETSGRVLKILEPDVLTRISGFEPDYLHLGMSRDGAGVEPAAKGRRSRA